MKPGSQSFMRFSNLLPSQASQSDVFELVKDSIQSFMRGVNNTVFAYGQTGAGKTYSIIGDYSHLDSRDNLEAYLMGSERGILSRSLEMILQEVKKAKDCRLLLSFFEIYNEKVAVGSCRFTICIIAAQRRWISANQKMAKSQSLT
jgi:kinesin family protein 11